MSFNYEDYLPRKGLPRRELPLPEILNELEKAIPEALEKRTHPFRIVADKLQMAEIDLYMKVEFKHDYNQFKIRFGQIWRGNYSPAEGERRLRFVFPYPFQDQRCQCAICGKDFLMQKAIVDLDIPRKFFHPQCLAAELGWDGFAGLSQSTVTEKIDLGDGTLDSVAFLLEYCPSLAHHPYY